jgi:hypothetical protein
MTHAVRILALIASVGLSHAAGPPRSVQRPQGPHMNLFDPNLTRAEVMIRKPVQTPCCSPMHDDR